MELEDVFRKEKTPNRFSRELKKGKACSAEWYTPEGKLIELSTWAPQDDTGSILTHKVCPLFGRAKYPSVLRRL